MQFANIKLLMKWFFYDFKWKEMPKGLRSAASASEAIGREPCRIQDVEVVMKTHAKILQVLKSLSDDDISILRGYYRKYKTLARIMRDQHAGRNVHLVRVSRVEDKLEARFARVGLLAEPEYEPPVYAKDDPDWIYGAKNIAEFVGKTSSWFYQYGIKNKKFKKLIRKNGDMWEARAEELREWTK